MILKYMIFLLLNLSLQANNISILEKINNKLENINSTYIFKDIDNKCKLIKHDKYNYEVSLLDNTIKNSIERITPRYNDIKKLIFKDVDILPHIYSQKFHDIVNNTQETKHKSNVSKEVTFGYTSYSLESFDISANFIVLTFSSYSSPYKGSTDETQGFIVINRHTGLELKLNDLIAKDSKLCSLINCEDDSFYLSGSLIVFENEPYYIKTSKYNFSEVIPLKDYIKPTLYKKVLS